MINIVIPMAGHGSRFAKQGYKLPKPLIPIHTKPMIEAVINNIRPKKQECRFIYLCLQKHIEDYEIDKLLKNITADCEIVVVDSVTEGAACTVLLAEKYINNDDALMIANSDQWVDINIDDYLDKMDKENADGLIMTMFADDPKWSFVKYDGDKICEVVEKEVVSNEATVGIYNYKHGKDFVTAAKQMIKNNFRVNNEFYVAPAYNEMVKSGKKLTTYNIGSEFDGMYGLGIPEDLEKFKKISLSIKAEDACNTLK